MAKMNDQFEKFREATLGNTALGDIIEKKLNNSEEIKEEKRNRTRTSRSTTPNTQVSILKPASKWDGDEFIMAGAQEQLSFWIDKNIKKELAVLSSRMGLKQKEMLEMALLQFLKEHRELL